MSQRKKLLERLQSNPDDFTSAELETLMNQCGCRKSNKGKTSGSRIAYVHQETGRMFLAHSPHPARVLKHYQVKAVIGFLDSIGMLEE